MHRIYLESPISQTTGEVSIAGEEAEHALRVKRLGAGSGVELLDGMGMVARGVVVAGDEAGKKPGGGRRGGRELVVRVEDVRRVEPVRPRVEVWSATPKGGRVDEMIDGLSQVGVAAWRPMHCERSVVEPREGKLGRLERIAREACKQAGRAWVMEIGGCVEFAQAVGVERGVVTIVADASGGLSDGAELGDRVRLLVGPEGGFTAEELALARSAGARVVRFGPHTMRVETAAMAGAAVVLAGAEQR